MTTYREHFAQIWSAQGLTEYLARDFDPQEVARQLASEDTRYLLAEREVIGSSKLRYPRPPLVVIGGRERVGPAGSGRRAVRL